MEEHCLGINDFLLHQDIRDLMTTHVKNFSIHRVTSSKDMDKYVLIHINIKIDIFLCTNNLLLKLIVL